MLELAFGCGMPVINHFAGVVDVRTSATLQVRPLNFSPIALWSN